jgi:hypothetical protein
VRAAFWAILILPLFCECASGFEHAVPLVVRDCTVISECEWSCCVGVLCGLTSHSADRDKPSLAVHIHGIIIYAPQYSHFSKWSALMKIKFSHSCLDNIVYRDSCSISSCRYSLAGRKYGSLIEDIPRGRKSSDLVMPYTALLLFHPRENVQAFRWDDFRKASNINGRGVPAISESENCINGQARIGDCQIIRIDRYNLDPRTLVGTHFLQLSLHRILLTKEDQGSYRRYYESRYVQPEPSPLPRITTIVIAFLLLSVSVLLMIYSLKRDDYLLVVGVLIQFVPFALGLELLLYNDCPPFFVSLYSALPICRYVIP